MRKYVILLILVLALAGCTPEAAEHWQPLFDTYATQVALQGSTVPAPTPEPTVELPTVTPVPEAPDWDQEQLPDDTIDDTAPPVPDVPVVVLPCDIKGNIGAKGALIYHLPGGANYDQVVIDPQKGERLFCTTEEAEAAGWRRAAR